MAVAMTLALASAALGQDPGAWLGQPTPAEHEEAIQDAQRVGRYLFMRYSLQRQAAELLIAAGVEDERIEGITMAVDAGQLLVRFVGTVGGELMSLHEVSFDDLDAGNLLELDAPRALPMEEERMHRAKQAALAANPFVCEEKYTPILSFSPELGQLGRDVYLIPYPANRKAVAIGGHSRVQIAPDGETVLEVEPLSKGCLTMDEPEAGAEQALFVMSSHLLSSTPIVPHVLMSLLHEKPMAVVTDAGSWMVVAGTISFVGPHEDEDEDEALADAGVPPLGPPVRSDYEPAAEGPSASAPWRRRLIVWRDSEDTETPWRDDERLAGLFAEGFPDDVAVMFPPNEGENRAELMWVRVLAYDAESERYLAFLLNKPGWLTGVEQYENVVFGYDPKIGRQLARSADGDYAALSVPDAARGGHLGSIYQAVLHLRRSESGKNRQEIVDCIQRLMDVVPELGGEIDPADRYVAHYTLGRCLAEEYESDAAVEQFHKAAELRPEALDPQMGLLAEYSVQMHGNPASTEAEWRYLAQLELVRELYADHQKVAQLLAMVFDEKIAGDLSGVPAEEIERRRRVGFGPFRWQMP